jgi:hypothetical protein
MRNTWDRSLTRLMQSCSDYFNPAFCSSNQDQLVLHGIKYKPTEFFTPNRSISLSLMASTVRALIIHFIGDLRSSKLHAHQRKHFFFPFT